MNNNLFYKYVRYGLFRCVGDWKTCDWMATLGLISFWVGVIVIQVLT